MKLLRTESVDYSRLYKPLNEAIAYLQELEKKANESGEIWILDQDYDLIQFLMYEKEND